jgi:hypothetical protein
MWSCLSAAAPLFDTSSLEIHQKKTPTTFDSLVLAFALSYEILF